jgi:hypothetical protein
MTDSGTGSTTSSVGDGQPSSTSPLEDDLGPEADLSTRNENKPISQVRKPSPWRDRLARLARALPRSTGWIATILIGSLLVPAVTKQWSDRPKELEIKTSLIREMSELTTDTINEPVNDLYGFTPASRLLLLREEDLAKAKKARKPSKADIAEAQKKRDDAYEAKTLESAKNRVERGVVWKNKGAAVKAQLSAYFSGTHLPREWDALVTAVVYFEGLASISCDRSANITYLRSYLHDDKSASMLQWQLFQKSPYEPSGCLVSDFKRFIISYNFLASRLLLKEQKLLDSIMKSDMVGFSKGWHDLFNDVISGGS